MIRVFDQNSSEASSEIVEALKAPAGYEQSVKIETHKKFENELAEIADKLGSISESRLLTEPFDRLYTACEQVHLQKTSE